MTDRVVSRLVQSSALSASGVQERNDGGAVISVGAGVSISISPVQCSDIRELIESNGIEYDFTADDGRDWNVYIETDGSVTFECWDTTTHSEPGEPATYSISLPPDMARQI